MVGADRRADARRASRSTTCSRHAPRALVRPRDASRCPARSARDPVAGHRSTIRRRGSSARSSTCSASAPAGHPDPRPLVRHAFWPDGLLPAPQGRRPPRVPATTAGPSRSSRSAARASTRSRSGPVHAGIIEPGPLPLQRGGRDDHRHEVAAVLHPQGHREALRGPRRPPTASSWPSACPGDTTVGHALALLPGGGGRCAATVAPPRARYLRVILLELERLYNHVGDFGDDRQRHGLRASPTPTASASASGCCG